MEYHYTWEFATYFEPVVGWLHRVGFFSFYIHLPVNSVLGTILFLSVYPRLYRDPVLSQMNHRRRRWWLSIYYGVSWLTMTSFGVGLKTMIIEELDYQERQWFEPYIAPGHLYISTVCIVYLVFLLKRKRGAIDWVLAGYIQVALIVGYIIGVRRIVGEDIEGALSGVFLNLFFIACNYDVVRRLRSGVSVALPTRAGVSSSEAV
ncbi:MAG: hypothetical protein RMM98_01540 [Acidobacteriota bacterium]|nr:hypothetical protein [Acidobacteriota bacterium]